VSLRHGLLVAAIVLVLLAVLNWELIVGTRDRVGGVPPVEVRPAARPPGSAEGARVFAAQCGACHGAHADWPITERLRGRSEQDFYDVLGHLPAVNPVMPGFAGTEPERRALARHLASLTPTVRPAETAAPAR
jgi:mono/diheme cytochrome c family protein